MKDSGREKKTRRGRSGTKDLETKLRAIPSIHNRDFSVHDSVDKTDIVVLPWLVKGILP